MMSSFDSGAVILTACSQHLYLPVLMYSIFFSNGTASAGSFILVVMREVYYVVDKENRELDCYYYYDSLNTVVTRLLPGGRGSL